MASVIRSKNLDYLYIGHNYQGVQGVIGTPRSGFLIGSGQFHTDGLQEQPGTFSDNQSLEISQNLAVVGLSCSANTPDKVHSYASEIVHVIAGTQVSSGTALGDAAKVYHYNVDNTI